MRLSFAEYNVQCQYGCKFNPFGYGRLLHVGSVSLKLRTYTRR